MLWQLPNLLANFTKKLTQYKRSYIGTMFFNNDDDDDISHLAACIAQL